MSCEIHNDVFKNLRGHEREIAIHRHDCPRAWDFWTKHNGMTLADASQQHSCFGCGKVGERAIEHLELPNIYLCAICADKIKRG